MVKQWIQHWVAFWRGGHGVVGCAARQAVPDWQVPAYRRRQISGDRCVR